MGLWVLVWRFVDSAVLGPPRVVLDIQFGLDVFAYARGCAGGRTSTGAVWYGIQTIGAAAVWISSSVGIPAALFDFARVAAECFVTRKHEPIATEPSPVQNSSRSRDLFRSD